MVTRLRNIFAKEESPEPEKVIVHENKPDWDGKTELTEIKKFKFTFRPFPDCYFEDKNGDLYYMEQPTEKELLELDRDETDKLNLKMRKIENPGKSIQLHYDCLQESHTLEPGESKMILVERKKTRIFVSGDGHYFTGAHDKQYILVEKFTEQEEYNEVKAVE